MTARPGLSRARRGLGASVELRIEQEGLPRVKTAVYDYEGLMPELRPGDLAEFLLEFISALERYGEERRIYTPPRHPPARIPRRRGGRM